ncbi:MAG: hypothetical protein AAF078_03045, partial [Planctomycetota bacterium]
AGAGGLGSIHWIDWLVIIGYLALVSVLGVKLAGKQKSMEDFFRGGNRLPWYAVSASMIATIISAVTFIGVPSIAFRDGGNFTYLQFGFLAGLFSRVFVAAVLVPAYYRYEVYSPYDFMGRELGESARSVTTALFSLLGLLAQAARVYLTALILALVLHDQLAGIFAGLGFELDAAQITFYGFAISVVIVGIVSVIWTMLGGIATVVWTDAMLFVVFVVGGLIALAVIVAELPGGLGQVIDQGWDEGKFKLWSLELGFGGGEPDPDVEPSPWHAWISTPYTFWAAFFAVTVGNIGSYGTDQLLAQRIFCCKNQNHAKAAVVSSWAGEAVVALMLLVGVGLWAYYAQFPERLEGPAAELVATQADKVFPIFIMQEVPVGLTGLILAGVFAAAISSLTSILAALSQTSLSAIYLPLRQRSTGVEPQGNEVLLVSRVLIVVWGVALCAMAFAVNAYVLFEQSRGNDVPFLDLALGIASYIVGTLLAAFLLAWLPVKITGYGLIWAAPLSIFMVYASRYHDVALAGSVDVPIDGLGDLYHLTLCGVVGAVLLITWVVAALAGPAERRGVRLAKAGWLLLGCVALLAMTAYGYFEVDKTSTGDLVPVTISWPWYAPLGATTALLFGYLLADPRKPDAAPAAVATSADQPAPQAQAAAAAE